MVLKFKHDHIIPSLLVLQQLSITCKGKWSEKSLTQYIRPTLVCRSSARAYTHVHTCTHMHTCIHAHTCTCTHVHRHTHTGTHVHTHTCTHVHTCTHSLILVLQTYRPHKLPGMRLGTWCFPCLVCVTLLPPLVLSTHLSFKLSLVIPPHWEMFFSPLSCSLSSSVTALTLFYRNLFSVFP